ncbi:MAG: hypothetical protein R3292_02560 [Alcanivorax sp.]|nr:hypothetical protein [Alcanivorax sp.]
MRRMTLPLAALLTLFMGQAQATSLFQQDSILVSSEHNLYAFSPSGSLRSRVPIPINASGEQARDLTLIGSDAVAVFNGTFSPLLSVMDAQGWSSRSIDGWSTVNNISYGGMASLGSQLFLTDGATSGGAARGIISLDTVSGDYQRYLTDSDYIDITLGQDGNLYALRDTYGSLDVIDPSTLTLLHTVNLGYSSYSRGVTASANGDLYVAGWNGFVSHYSASGELLDTLDIGGNLTDIDINHAGAIAVGSRFGNIYLTDLSLATFTAVSVSSGVTFTAFAEVNMPPAPPQLTASKSRKGAWITTTLSWTTQASGVDVYFNDVLRDSINGEQGSVSYTEHKKEAQTYKICNAGTELCAPVYVAN